MEQGRILMFRLSAKGKFIWDIFCHCDLFNAVYDDFAAQAVACDLSRAGSATVEACNGDALRAAVLLAAGDSVGVCGEHDCIPRDLAHRQPALYGHADDAGAGSGIACRSSAQRVHRVVAAAKHLFGKCVRRDAAWRVNKNFPGNYKI